MTLLYLRASRNESLRSTKRYLRAAMTYAEAIQIIWAPVKSETDQRYEAAKVVLRHHQPTTSDERRARAVVSELREALWHAENNERDVFD
ncbi:hypothetical protein [Beijerinckia sp. L45]|uniref:hypothetical protein n=1 Tax=Beijerinckia sp. L45 TaxID=1641855 RepID=UPI00131A9A21|nr:hypothetical protein [Beijerinckia sp. L45]